MYPNRGCAVWKTQCYICSQARGKYNPQLQGLGLPSMSSVSIHLEPTACLLSYFNSTAQFQYAQVSALEISCPFLTMHFSSENPAIQNSPPAISLFSASSKKAFQFNQNSLKEGKHTAPKTPTQSIFYQKQIGPHQRIVRDVLVCATVYVCRL